MYAVINLMFVLAKGAKTDMAKTWPCKSAKGYKDITYSDCSALNNAATWIAAAVAAGVAVVAGGIAMPFLFKALRRDIKA